MATKKLATSIFGGFSNPAYITTDGDKDKTDPYIKAEVIPSRYTGANFKVAGSKSGRGRDAYFAKEFPTRASKDQNKNGVVDEYWDSGVLSRREAMKSKAKNIVKDGNFKYASPPKRSTGSGSYFGTFDGKPIPHKEEYKVQQRGDVTSKFTAHQPKNITTKPGKKGTFGFSGTLFSKFEYPAKADDFDMVRRQEIKEWEESKKKMLSNGVFKSTIKPITTFDQKAATGISSAYDHYDAPEEKEGKKKRKPKKPDSKPSKSLEDRPVFKYSGSRKSHNGGCLNPFPNTYDKVDPADAKSTKAKEDKKADPGPKYGTWKPVSAAKSSVVRSLLKTYY